MEQQPLLSVIVPVYNVEQYLPQCLDSIIGQTYPNLEIILVDDGSTDRSGAICDEYAQRDSRITVIHKENGGQSSARNLAMEIITGDFVSFVDSDDWIEANLYSDFVQYVNNDPNCNIWQFCLTAAYLNRTEPTLHGEECRIVGDEVRKAFVLQEPVWEYVCDKIWDAKLISRFRFIEGRQNEDALFNFECVFRTEAIVLKHNLRCYYNYRQERENSTTFGNNPKPFVDQFEGLRVLISSLEKENSPYLVEAYAYTFYAIRRAMVGRFNQSQETRRVLPNFYPYLGWIKAKCQLRLLGGTSLKDWLFAHFPKIYLYLQYVAHR